MKKAISNTITILALPLVLSACSAAWNSPNEVVSVAERHPIAVDSQVVTLTLDPTGNGELSMIDKARLKSFADNYLRIGYGPVTITAPSGASQATNEQSVAAQIRSTLNEAGVSYAAMSGSSYRAGSGAGAEIVVSFTRYVATASPCGEWRNEVRNRYKNIASESFGCADQNNLAAMIADPRDLVTPADVAPSDAPARVRAIESFRQGDVTASERDETIDTQVSN